MGGQGGRANLWAGGWWISNWCVGGRVCVPVNESERYVSESVDRCVGGGVDGRVRLRVKKCGRPSPFVNHCFSITIVKK